MAFVTLQTVLLTLGLLCAVPRTFGNPAIQASESEDEERIHQTPDRVVNETCRPKSWVWEFLNNIQEEGYVMVVIDCATEGCICSNRTRSKRQAPRNQPVSSNSTDTCHDVSMYEDNKLVNHLQKKYCNGSTGRRRRSTYQDRRRPTSSDSGGAGFPGGWGPTSSDRGGAGFPGPLGPTSSDRGGAVFPDGWGRSTSSLTLTPNRPRTAYQDGWLPATGTVPGDGVAAAFLYARETLSSAANGTSKKIIFTTDGGSWSDSTTAVISEATQAKLQGIQIESMGVMSGVISAPALRRRLGQLTSSPTMVKYTDAWDCLDEMLLYIINGTEFEGLRNPWNRRVRRAQIVGGAPRGGAFGFDVNQMLLSTNGCRPNEK